MNLIARRKHLQTVLQHCQEQLQTRASEHNEKLRELAYQALGTPLPRLERPQRRRQNTTDQIIQDVLGNVEVHLRQAIQESDSFRRAQRFQQAITAAELIRHWMNGKLGVADNTEDRNRRSLSLDGGDLRLAEFVRVRDISGEDRPEEALPGGGEILPRRRTSWVKYLSNIKAVAPSLVQHPSWPTDPLALNLLGETLGELLSQTNFTAETIVPTPDRVTQIYQEEYLGSCMHSQDSASRQGLSWYASAPARLLTLRSPNGKLAARAWLWNAAGPEGNTLVLDRIYPGGDQSAHVRAMIQYAQELGATDWKNSQSVKGQFSGGPYQITVPLQYPMPFLDSITNLTSISDDGQTGTLESNRPDGTAPRGTMLTMNNTRGTPELRSLMRGEPYNHDDSDDDE